MLSVISGRNLAKAFAYSVKLVIAAYEYKTEGTQLADFHNLLSSLKTILNI